MAADLDLYSIFCTVARCGSLSHAARELYVSQPAVSQSMHRLEDSLGRGALPAGVESALAMTVREAATNIQRHARARHAQASFAMEDGEAVLRIDDDGRGGAIVPGNGLAGMRERLEALSGRLHIAPGERGGTTLEARVPLAANDDTASPANERLLPPDPTP